MRLDHHPEFDQQITKTEKTYIIFSSGRTGSTWLALGLYKLGLGVPMEYFNITQRRGFSERFNVPETFHNEIHLAQYVQEILSRRTTQNGVFGTSIHMYQWMNLFETHTKNFTEKDRIDWLIQTLQNAFLNPHFIFLYRNDLLMQAISMNIARQTDSWSSSLAELREPKYSYIQIKNTLERVVYAVGLCKYVQSQITSPQCTFVYEDLEQNYDQIIKEVVTMLEIPIDDTSGLSTQTIKKQRTSRNETWKQRFLHEHQQG